MDYDRTYRWRRPKNRHSLCKLPRLDINPSKYARERTSFAECEDFLVNSLRGTTAAVKHMILYELALLYLQHGKDALADNYLHVLGIRYRLASIFFALKTSLSSISSSSSSNGDDISVHHFIANEHVVSFDNILPDSLLQPLLQGFDPYESPFWSSHGYPSPNFFSYNCNIRRQNSGKSDNFNLINQIATYLLPILDKQFPGKNLNKNIHSVEWWAHCRGRTDGHQLHYDLDEVALRKESSSTLSLDSKTVSANIIAFAYGHPVSG